MWAMLGGVAALTLLAIQADRNNPNHAIAVRTADQEAHRAVVLARGPDGIPVTGAVTLLRNDPLTQGPKIFAKSCASCHRYDGHDGLGGQPKDKPSAPDLKGFASRAWLTGFFDATKIESLQYFGGTAHKNGKMVKYVKQDVASFDEAGKKELAQAIVALSAEARLKSQRDQDKLDEALIATGTKALIGAKLSCIDCHRFHEEGEELGTAPDLTGYGSREWVIGIINNPEHKRFYGAKNDRMPAFGEEKQLTPHEIGLVTDWLRGEWYEPTLKKL
jgi:ubiquinol-cytochrome c reductase cytochrome b subunit